jgi:hypothetical protein
VTAAGRACAAAAARAASFVFQRPHHLMTRFARELLDAALAAEGCAEPVLWAYTSMMLPLGAGLRPRGTAYDDQRVSPTYVPDLLHAPLDLLVDGEGGIFHLANAGEVSWAELARRAARLAGLDPRSSRAVQRPSSGSRRRVRRGARSRASARR